MSKLVKAIKKLVLGKKTATSVDIIADQRSDNSKRNSDNSNNDEPNVKPVYHEIEEDGMVFAVIGGKKTPKSGSMYALINYLLDVKVYDLGYIYAFLLHHILFMDSWKLLELLIEKWKENADDQGDLAKAKVFSFIVLSDSVQQKLLNEPIVKTAILLNPPKSFKPKATYRSSNPSAFNDKEKEETSSFVLLDFDTLEIARQLTIIDFEYFQFIEAREFINSNWKNDKIKLCPNIYKLAQWSTSTMMWIVSEILSVKDLKLRAASLDHIIKVANELVKLKNFNSLKTILSAIFFPSVIRLRKTFNLLSKRTRDILEELKNLVSDKEDYLVLRKKIKTLKPPLIPYPELYYFDLASFDVCGPLITQKNDEEWISVEKMVNVSFMIKGIQNHQKSRFHYQTVEEIRDHILSFPRLSIKAAEETSLKLESSQ